MPELEQLMEPARIHGLRFCQDATAKAIKDLSEAAVVSRRTPLACLDMCNQGVMRAEHLVAGWAVYLAERMRVKQMTVSGQDISLQW